MENNLNQEGIDEYCDKFCSKLIEQHFVNRDSITGAELIEFHDIRQINLFLMKNLLSEWRKESSKIQSPYFDYQAKEVKEAQKEFMNVLSRHISVSKEYFRPLLVKSVRETLLLIFSPFDYYVQLINEPEKNSVSVTGLKRISKYIKINHNILTALIKKAESDGFDKMSKEDASRILNESIENIQGSPEDVDGYIEKFSNIIPLTTDIIYGGLYQENEKEVQENRPGHREPKSPSPASKIQINSRFDLPKQILNDKHTEDQRPTIADTHRNRKIESIRENISINQRFMFINVLFEGNEESFNATIDYLEQCSGKQEAVAYLSKEYPHWEKESDELNEFIEVINKRHQ